MPLENLEEDGLEKNPNLELAQTKFLLSLPEHKDDPYLKNKLLDAIKAESETAFFFMKLKACKYANAFNKPLNIPY